MTLSKNILLLALLLFVGLTDAASWTYTDGPYGPSNWSKIASICDGKVQSPINYKKDEITFDQVLGDISMTGYGDPKPGENVLLRNNGHSLVVDFNHPHTANISGSGLPGTFTLLNLHFHWGKNSAEGSEHKLYGKAFPAEAHFVHYNVKYVGNLTAALAAKDGLAVLGVFLEKSDSDNAALNPILNYAANVTATGANTTIPGFNTKSLLPSDTSKFLRNNGSLTTPDCQESVTWTVFLNKKTISEKQLNILRGLKKADGQPNLVTYRPIQATNGRKILATFPDPTTGGATAYNSVPFVSVLFALTSFIIMY